MTKRKCPLCKGKGHLTKSRAEIYAGMYAEAVRLRRENKLKWTHQALAERFGVSRTTIHKWIRGI